MINKIKTLRFFLKKKHIVAQYKLFWGDEWLENSIASIIDDVDSILLVISNVPWGDNKDNLKRDDFSEIIRKVKARNKVELHVIYDNWNDQLVQVQAGLNYIKTNIPEATHCLYIDGDEIYRKNELKKLLSLTKKVGTFNKSIRIQYNTYFRSLEYKIAPIKWSNLLVLFPIRDYTQYVGPREINGVNENRNDIICEHPAYVRNNDERMKQKMIAHSNSIEPIIENWYDDFWLNWSSDMTNFHPTHPKIWERLEKVNPIELKAMLKKL